MSESLISVYNSLTKSIDPLITDHPKILTMYICGPTVYSNAHLGHAKAYVTF